MIHFGMDRRDNMHDSWNDGIPAKIEIEELDIKDDWNVLTYPVVHQV